jgi:hypothetical protein
VLHLRLRSNGLPPLSEVKTWAVFGDSLLCWGFSGHNTLFCLRGCFLGLPGFRLLRSRPVSLSPVSTIAPSPGGRPVCVAFRSRFVGSCSPEHRNSFQSLTSPRSVRSLAVREHVQIFPAALRMKNVHRPSTKSCDVIPRTAATMHERRGMRLVNNKSVLCPLNSLFTEFMAPRKA